MNRDRAIEIRTRQLQGGDVHPAVLAEAIRVIAAEPGTLSANQWRYRRFKAGLVQPRGPKVLVDMSAARRAPQPEFTGERDVQAPHHP